MKCENCGKEIRPGEHVYPGGSEVWHTECGFGTFPAVMGSDGKLRWLDDQEWIDKEDEKRGEKNESP